MRSASVGRWLFVTPLIILLFSEHCFAHKVSIFAWVEGDTIYTESYFPDGNFVKNGKIKVINSSGEVVHSGVTDESGEHHFMIPQVDDLTIVLDASMGHRATFEISVEELNLVYRGSKRENVEVERSLYETEYNKNIDPDEIRKVVREELSQQLKPIVRSIAELQAKRKISAQEIFAGVGYVLGLMGIVMYFKSKGKK